MEISYKKWPRGKAMKVSIIIPIYNGERFIDGLYELLLKQSMQDFEVVFVNAGSSDKSYDMLLNLKQKDERIVIVDKTNGGICSARNAGIDAASGEYIIFLDQDDGFDEFLVEHYWDATAKNNADMAVFGKIHYFIDNDKITRIVPERFEDELVQDKLLLKRQILNLDNKKRFSTIWNCIYKSSILKRQNIKFDEHFKHGDEDGMFNAEYVMNSEKVVFSSECHYYYYLRNNHSTISKYNKDSVSDYLYFINKLFGLFSDCDAEMLDGFRLFALRFYSNVYKRYCRFNNKYSEKKDFIEDVLADSCFRNVTNYTGSYSSVSNIFWRLYCFFIKRSYENICILMLDFLLLMKRIKGQK